MDIFSPGISRNAGQYARLVASTIEQHGWCQHRLENAQGNVCLVGGYRKPLNLDSPDKLWSFMPFQVFRQWLRNTVAPNEDDAFSVPQWNDEPGRTQEEVLLYLNKFADEMDPQVP